MNKYYQEWKQPLLQSLGGVCVQCGSTENLEFDHIDESTKLFTISGRWSDKDQTPILEELKKCQVLCRSCHMKKTKPYLSKLHLEPGFTHGTIYAWMRKKCKCSVCEKSKRKWSDERNAKRRKSGRVLERNTGSA